MEKNRITFGQYYASRRFIPMQVWCNLLAVAFSLSWLLGKVEGGGVPLLLLLALIGSPPLHIYISWRLRDFEI